MFVISSVKINEDVSSIVPKIFIKLSSLTYAPTEKILTIQTRA